MITFDELLLRLKCHQGQEFVEPVDGADDPPATQDMYDF